MKALRNFILNLLTFFLSAALFLGGTELGLRAFYTKKLKTYYDSQTELVLGNPPAPKAPGEYRIFIFGESAAYGFPVADRYSVAAWMRKAFHPLLPSQKIRVINCGWPGKSSHQIAQGVRTVLKYKPDLLVMYVGNNEAGIDSRVFADSALHRADLVFYYRSYLYRLLKQKLDKARKYLLKRAGRPEQQTYRISEIAHKMYNRMEVTPAEYEKVVASYLKNMKDSIHSAKPRGVDVLFITLPSNLRNFPPGHSSHAASLSEPALAEWNRFYKEGEIFEKAGNQPKALEAYQKAATIDPTFSELQFRMAKIYDEAKEYEKAKEAFIMARDHDGLPGRATTRLNQEIRNLAATEGVELVDVAEIFAELSPQKIVSYDLMYDDVHPTVYGQQVIADAILKDLMKRGKIAETSQWNWPAYETARKNGVDWQVENTIEAYHEVLSGLLLWEQKRYPEAVSNLEKAIVSMPGFIESFAFLADSYYHLGQPEKGEAKLQYIADKDPELLGLLRKKYPDLEETCQKFFSAKGLPPA